jgi:heat shock protein HspQ
MLISISEFEGDAASQRNFECGAVVKHKFYGYRGVIVSIDPRCMAGDTWYQSTKTHPPRDQPWYHVLVHDSGGLSTYVAHSNLEADVSGKPINHPRIDCYFSDLKDGHYQLKKSKLL